MDLKPGAMVAGRYVLLRELARGGMGSVWAALHKKLDENVAIKFMDTELAESEDARIRFEREAKAAAKLRSPHVVQILDYGVDDDTPFIVMELLEGEDLKRRLKREGRLALGKASEILTQACKALKLSAEAGIVHRDLKPGNIFLATSGDDEVVKILDFGVAKGAHRMLIGPNTSSGMLLGSPHYMSPEQARKGATLDHRGDLWALAVILYQMITSKKPFDGEEIGDVIVKICTEPPPLVTTFVPELPSSIDHFFERALAKDPDARFQSARALASEFAAIASLHTGIPLPPSSLPGGPTSDPALGSYPSGRVRGWDSGSFPGDSDRKILPQTLSSTREGTLTLATRSFGTSKRPRLNKRKLAALMYGGVTAAVVALIGIAAIQLGKGSGEPAPQAAEPAPLAAETAATAQADAPTEAEASASEPSPSVAPDASAAAPRASGGAEDTALPVPVPEPARTVPPVAQPTMTARPAKKRPYGQPPPAKSEHPVLGF